jgi:hypothetical protein
VTEQTVNALVKEARNAIVTLTNGEWRLPLDVPGLLDRLCAALALPASGATWCFDMSKAPFDASIDIWTKVGVRLADCTFDRRSKCWNWKGEAVPQDQAIAWTVVPLPPAAHPTPPAEAGETKPGELLPMPDVTALRREAEETAKGFDKFPQYGSVAKLLRSLAKALPNNPDVALPSTGRTEQEDEWPDVDPNDPKDYGDGYGG